MKHGIKTKNFLNRFTTVRLYYMESHSIKNDIMVYKIKLIDDKHRCIHLELASFSPTWEVWDVGKHQLERDVLYHPNCVDLKRDDLNIVMLLLKPHNYRNAKTEQDVLNCLLH